MPETATNNRRNRKTRKAERTRKIIWAVIILVAALLVVLKIWEVDFNTIKRTLTGTSGEGIISNVSDNIYPYSLDTSKSVKITPQNDKLNILTSASCTVLNPTSGEADYTFSHGYSNPIEKTAGNYFCVIDQGSNRFRLDTLNGSVYSLDTDFSILTADVSNNGSVIYALQDDNSKSHVTLLNKSRKKLLDFDVNSGYVVAVAVDSGGKHCAYAVVNSKNAKLITTIFTINAGDKKEKASFELEGSNILDMKYCQGDLFVVADNYVGRISAQKKLKDIFKKGEVNTCCYNYTKENELVYVYSKYSSANENYLTYINSSGKVKTTVELKQKPKYVSSSSNEMTVLFTDRIVAYSLTSGEEKGSAVCDDSISVVHKLSTKCFVCRHQVIDVVEMKSKDK